MIIHDRHAVVTEVQFFLGGEAYALWFVPVVPLVGDEVMLRDKARSTDGKKHPFRVTRRVFGVEHVDELKITHQCVNVDLVRSE